MLVERLGDDVLRSAIELVPEAWMKAPTAVADPRARRAAYLDYLRARRDAAPAFLEEAIRAHAQRV